MHGSEGTLLKGSSDEVLPAGRYRLHVPLAMAPLGDLNVSFIAITITAGANKRNVTLLHFPQADEFIDLSLDFTAPGGTMPPFSVTWSLASEAAKRNRVKILNPDIDPEAHTDVGEDVDTEAPNEAKDGTISVAELAKIPDHLAARGVSIETLCPLEISEVSADKITYRPGEAATAAVTLKNYAATPITTKLTVELISGTGYHTPLHSEDLEIPRRKQTLVGAF